GNVFLMEAGSYDVWSGRAGADTHVYGPQWIELSVRRGYTIVAGPTADAWHVSRPWLGGCTSCPRCPDVSLCDCAVWPRACRPGADVVAARYERPAGLRPGGGAGHLRRRCRRRGRLRRRLRGRDL